MKKIIYISLIFGIVGTLIIVGVNYKAEPATPKEPELESQPKEIVQEDTSQIEQELKQTQLEVEKTQAEAEKAQVEAEKTQLEAKRLKAEQEAKKAKEEAERMKQEIEEVKAKDEAERLKAEEEQRKLEKLEEQQRQEEQQLVRAKEDLDKIERDIKNWLKADTCRNDFRNYESTKEMLALGIPELTNRVNQEIETICNKVRQLENQLIQEVEILKQTNDVRFLIRGMNSLLNQLEGAKDMVKQVIDDEVRKTAEVFVRLSKQLEEELKKAKEEVERKKKAGQAINQLVPILEDVNNQLVNLYIQIEDKKVEIENAKNMAVPMSFIEGRLAQLIPEHNALVTEYNLLLSTEQRIRTILYRLDDYFEYGTPIPVEDRAFLSSLGIYL